MTMVVLMHRAVQRRGCESIVTIFVMSFAVVSSASGTKLTIMVDAQSG